MNHPNPAHHPERGQSEQHTDDKEEQISRDEQGGKQEKAGSSGKEYPILWFRLDTPLMRCLPTSLLQGERLLDRLSTPSQRLHVVGRHQTDAFCRNRYM